jgi:hypothetical protein
VDRSPTLPSVRCRVATAACAALLLIAPATPVATGLAPAMGTIRVGSPGPAPSDGGVAQPTAHPAGASYGWPGHPAYGWSGYRRHGYGWYGYGWYGAWPCYPPGLCRYLWRDEARRAREEALRREAPPSPFDPPSWIDPWGDGGIWGYVRRIPPPTAEEEIRPEYRDAGRVRPEYAGSGARRGTP